MTRVIPIDKNNTALDEFLPVVLLRGCKKYPTYAAIKRRCEQLYGATLEYYYSYFGDNLMINYCVDFLSDAFVGTHDTILDGAVELMAQIWLNPILDANGHFLEDEVEKSKNAFNDAIRASDNDTAAYALRRTREIICERDSNRYSVSVEDVEKITAESLVKRYIFLRNNDDSNFFYVGNQSADKISKILNKYFGNIEYVAPADVLLNPVLHLPQAKVEEQTLPVTQGKLTLGITTEITMSDNDYYAMLVAVEVLGGNSASKLFINVRERLGLCYYCNAAYSKLKGIVYVSAGIDSEDRDIIKKEIIHQIEQLKVGNISESELRVAQLSLINAARQLSDRPYSMWSFCNTRLMLSLSTDIDCHIDMINAVSISDITRVVQKWKLSGEFFINSNGSDTTENDN